MSDSFIKQYLLTAGPTPIPPEVSLALAEPVVYHRAPAFVELFERTLVRLKKVFLTENEVLLFAASGSGAMESAVANLVAANEEVLVCAAGKFGERWLELCHAYRASVTSYEPGWGQRLDPQAIEQSLRQIKSDSPLVFATLSETSTGIVNDIRAVADVVNAHNGILVVDAVSGLGATELRQDDWNIDVVVAGSQKALMCPPGLAFASVSPRAAKRAQENSTPRYYFDWPSAIKAQQQSSPQTLFTPAVNLLNGLDVALAMIEQQGLDAVLKRHDTIARAIRAGVAALGLNLYGDPDERSTVVTAVELPSEIDGGAVPSRLRELGITANGGQGQLKGKIIRIAHCGYFGAFDMIIALSGLEMVLKQLGYDLEQGAGVAAAQQVFLDAGVPVTSK